MHADAGRFAAICILALTVSLGIVGCQKQPPASSPSLPPPTIDGDLRDPCWERALEIRGDWVDVEAGGVKVDAPPKVLVWYDASKIYIAYQNPEPRMKDLLAEVTERDGNVWTDDSIEVFFDPTGGQASYYQFIVNAKGVLYDGQGRSGDWDSEAEAKAAVSDDGWTVELAVPLSNLGVKGSPKGQTWKVNFCRNRYVTGKLQGQTWSDTGKSFHNVAAFKALTLD